MTATPVSLPPTPAPNLRRSAVVIGDDIQIPAWVDDHDSFRRWAWSDEFPPTGQFSYFQGIVWADVSMEELFTHNQVKVAFTAALVVLLQKSPLGRFIGDRMLLSNVAAGLSTEPDGAFYSWETMKTGRHRKLKGAKRGIMELEGTPDMSLEVVSASSVRKDTVILRRLYWEAGVKEYWLVDVRGKPEKFEILRHDKKGYAVTPAKDGWSTSEVFGHKFRLRRQSDALGDPQYVVETK